MTSEQLDVGAKDIAEVGKDEKELEKKKHKEATKPELPPVPFLSLFRFASTTDRILISLSLLAAASTGVAMPVMLVLFGDLTNAFVYNDISRQNFTGLNISYNFNITVPDLGDAIATFGLGVTGIGILLLVAGYVFVTCLNITAENQVYRIRSVFLSSILRQDIGWYDTKASNDFASRMTEDLNKIQEGIGEKIGMFSFCFVAFLANIINAFIHGWELTLVIMAAMPVLTVSMGILAKVQASLTANEMTAYGLAGSVAEQALGAIRTVLAFGGERSEISLYEKNLDQARKAGLKRGLVTGIGAGLTWFIIYGSYALAFWYGVKLILDGYEGSSNYDPSSLVVVFFSVLSGAMQMGQASPYIEAFSIARGAAATIFNIIDRQPPIDSSSKAGKRPDKLRGEVSFHNVKFNYPARPDVKILQGLSFKVKAGESVALVGSSGCGKSTCIQLIQRFYDPLEGEVKVDDNNVRDLNIGWLRDCIGVVGQEPVLFGTTIGENIRYGRDNVTDDEIVNAAKMANAHDFIMKLPKRYDTLVGERGTQLSGGQKQRVAIARALVRNPRILLLDEATSALDNQSESIVQRALDKAREGRTTIIVAHRLSTIRGASKIIVLDKGVLQEEGTHSELMAKKGLYYQLVTAQRGGDLGDDEEDDQPPSYEDVVDEKPLSRQLSNIGDNPNKIEEEEKTETPEVSIFKILRYNASEWPYIAAGLVGACIVGLSIPAYAVMFGEVMDILSASEPDARKRSVFYAILFLIAGFITGIAAFFQAYMFGVAGEFLTSRLRAMTFSAMLKQEMGWFDQESNSCGALCARLSGDAASVQGATGTRLGVVFQSLATLTFCVGLSLYYQWKLGLVTCIFIPLVLLSTYFQARIIMGQNAVEKKSIEKSSKVAMEAISNIRTVASLRREEKIHDVYMKALNGPHVSAKKRSHVRGIVFGFAQSVPMFAYAACMYYGGYLVENEGLDYSIVFKVSEALIFGTMMVGQSVAFAPNYNKAKVAAFKIIELLERKPLIDTSPTAGKSLKSCSGEVNYVNVDFAYPTRQDVQVLKALRLLIKPGQTVALVGHSGCGKSTCIQLLERFYDPAAGEVRLDEQNIAPINVPNLRSQLGIVSQEPALFNRSIADNIAYGDNSRTVPMNEIMAAARKANIHNFIISLPAGYETLVGDKGTQLSGGQKQRVAIARALVRNPKILLLDEATSALDSESEKVVQEALDTARLGRTCITIAHRLSTIQNADSIAVISHGVVAEQGTHQELIDLGGLYYELYTMQGGVTGKKRAEVSKL